MVISKGATVAEKDVLNLIELLMNQLLKLDGIIADGDVKLQRKMQVVFGFAQEHEHLDFYLTITSTDELKFEAWH